jgi:hypothetical protein
MSNTATTTTEYDWVIIRDGRTPGNFRIWSRHKTEVSARKQYRLLVHNGAEGRCKVILADEAEKWGATTEWE